MALVKKCNAEYTVPEEKVKEYLAMGYSLIDESGKVIQKGAAHSKDELAAENNALKKENAVLKKALNEKDEKLKTLAKQVENLNFQLAEAKKQKPNEK